jgi:chromosome segregation ATPase
MSEGLTNLQQQSDNQILKLILMTLQGLTGHIISFDSRFGSLERHFDRFETRVDRLDLRLENLEHGLKKVQTDIAQLQKSHDDMRGDIHDLNNVVGDLSRNQTVLNDTVRKMDHDFRDIFEQLHIVEAPRHEQNSTT